MPKPTKQPVPLRTALQRWIDGQRALGIKWSLIARQLGVTRQCVDLWWRGKAKPSTQSVVAIADRTGLGLLELLM